ncbi:flagellar filament capping protein FliD [Ammoniphilus sp. CFH 90114]|uniref:flagellar filament capping protein FliD n=1 Tax=Ammoniphilus sp. CFH 90114 TaxID=2493665 RepID=UPI00100E38F1|nr:flagellar filament capping protein FliD [Ammoniphilus sp. CFH 90114]RXT04455.1 hypothetical protein EIZ39_19720 [Ammoniphilus sp. CFH 90114]
MSTINPFSPTRITGMASGMDTDSLVQKLMSAERLPVNRLKKQQQKMLWQSEAYRQWNTDLFTFRSKTLFDMRLSKTFNTFNVQSSQSDAVSAVATGDAIAGTYNMTVKGLAESATLKGNKVNLDPTKKLSDLGARALSAETTLKLSVTTNPDDPKTLSADIAIKPTDTINDVVSKLNGAKDTSGKSLGLQAIYDKNLQQFILKTKDTGAATKIDFSGSSAEGKDFLSKTLGFGSSAYVTGTTVIDPASPTPVTIDSTNNTLTIDLGGGATNLSIPQRTYNSTEDLVKAMNESISGSPLASKVGAFADETGRIGFRSETTGGSSFIKVSGNASLGYGAEVSANGSGITTTQGRNAQIVFDGNEINTFTRNDFNIMGVNYTIKKPTVDASGNYISSSLTFSRNVDEAVKNVKAFVDKYNELLEKLQKTISEPVNRSYEPLLDEDKENLTEDQIKKWEEKAKSGLLRNDPILSDITNKLRSYVTSSVANGSSYNTLASIGIKSNSLEDRGKLSIDEDKLKKVLEEDPDAVMNLFSQSGDKLESKGIVNRLMDDLDEQFTKFTKKAGVSGKTQYDQSTIGLLLTQTQSRINVEDRNLTRKESNYYKQFAAMETALSKYNSQSSYLMQLFGGGV